MIIGDFFNLSKPVAPSDFVICASLGAVELGANFYKTSFPVITHLMVPLATVLIASKIIYQLGEAFSHLNGWAYSFVDSKKMYSLLLASFITFKVIQLFGVISPSSLIVTTLFAAAWSERSFVPANPEEKITPQEEKLENGEYSEARKILFSGEILPTVYNYRGTDAESIAEKIIESFQSKTDLNIIYYDPNPKFPAIRVVYNASSDPGSSLMFFRRSKDKESSNSHSDSVDQCYTVLGASKEKTKNSSLYSQRCIVMTAGEILEECDIYLQETLAKYQIDVHFEEKNPETTFYLVRRLPSHRFSPPSEPSSSTKPLGDALLALRIKKFGPKSSSKEKEKDPASEVG